MNIYVLELFLNLFLNLSKTFLEHNVFLNCFYICSWLFPGLFVLCTDLIFIDQSFILYNLSFPYPNLGQYEILDQFVHGVENIDGLRMERW